MAITIATLKRTKNSVIGNPSAKLALAQRTDFIQLLVNCLNDPPSPVGEPQGSQDDIRIEAAHVISSISYGSDDALKSLLNADALQAFLYALATLQPDDSPALQKAMLRALRTLASSMADVVGPSQFGLSSYSSSSRDEAKAALELLFKIECLDTFIPLLDNNDIQLSTFVAQLIGSAVRDKPHRTAITGWYPLGARIKEVKAKRGWEKPECASSKLGGWVVHHLISLLQCRNDNVKEAALTAIAALAKDNPSLAVGLARSHDREAPVPLTTVLSLTASRSIEVQIAACLCTTHIIRANATTYSGSVDHAIASNIIHTLNRVLVLPSERPLTLIKACYVLHYLVKDDKDLCQVAVDHGTLTQLASLVKSITPLSKNDDWDEDEPESTASLREAALTVIASLSLFDNDIRRDIADGLQLIPIIHTSLTNRHVGVRYAACQCVRALSRAVAILRTNIMDSGLGSSLFDLFKKEDEDPRVTAVALAAVTNMVNEFSPLQPMLCSRGLIPRFMQLMATDNHTKVNVLWAIKNLLRKSTLKTKQNVMNELGWKSLAQMCLDPDTRIQEQANAIFRNLAENDPGIELIMQRLDTSTLSKCLLAGLDSSDEGATVQAASFLANLSNGPLVYQDSIFSNLAILQAMHLCITSSTAEIRSPIVCCVFQILQCNPKRRGDLNDIGIISTLRHMCDRTGGVSVSPGGRYSSHLPIDDDKETITWARRVLDLLERQGDDL